MEPVLLPASLSREFLLRHRCCPLHLDDGGRLRVATEGGIPGDLCDDLEMLFDAQVVPVEVEPGLIPIIIERTATRSAARGITIEAAATPSLFASDARDLARQAPVVRYVNLLLRDAVEARASDIHIEAGPAGAIVRVRRDGILQPALAPPPGLEEAVASRVKLLADLDIAERRAPQDGRFRARIDEGTEVDVRVSAAPTVHGESLVLRILDRVGGRISLESLGLPRSVEDTLRRIAGRNTGLVLATGPTGSGKTTTLYALLGCRDPSVEKVITIEDPVEYSIERVNQIPVHAEVGVTFASALRSVLRQDPDVIMVGEVRDAETAGLAVQAALTGHLVFASLHTNDAPSAIPRLLDLDVPDFLVHATLSAVLAQRLVRLNCSACARIREPDPVLADALRARLPPDLALPGAVFAGTGCEECGGSGYRGRLGIFDLLVTAQDGQGAETDQSRGGGLLRDAVAKLAAGLTSLQEVVRVVS